MTIFKTTMKDFGSLAAYCTAYVFLIVLAGGMLGLPSAKASGLDKEAYQESGRFINLAKDVYYEFDGTMSIYKAMSTYKYCTKSKWYQKLGERDKQFVIFSCDMDVDSYTDHIGTRIEKPHNANLKSFRNVIIWEYNELEQLLQEHSAVLVATWDDGKYMVVNETSDDSELAGMFKDIYNNESILERYTYSDRQVIKAYKNRNHRHSVLEKIMML